MKAYINVFVPSRRKRLMSCKILPSARYPAQKPCESEQTSVNMRGKGSYRCSSTKPPCLIFEVTGLYIYGTGYKPKVLFVRIQASETHTSLRGQYGRNTNTLFLLDSWSETSFIARKNEIGLHKTQKPSNIHGFAHQSSTGLQLGQLGNAQRELVDWLSYFTTHENSKVKQTTPRTHHVQMTCTNMEARPPPHIQYQRICTQIPPPRAANLKVISATLYVAVINVQLRSLLVYNVRMPGSQSVLASKSNKHQNLKTESNVKRLGYTACVHVYTNQGRSKKRTALNSTAYLCVPYYRFGASETALQTIRFWKSPF